MKLKLLSDALCWCGAFSVPAAVILGLDLVGALWLSAVFYWVAFWVAMDDVIQYK